MVIDFHSHVLPGIDDGSSSVEESLALLRLQASQGIGCTVATPHFYPRHQKMEDFLRHRQASYEHLMAAAQGLQELPQVILGAEVHYFPGMGSSEELSCLAAGDSGYILIELPQGQWSKRVYEDLEEVRARQGLRPIIAHVDRYISPFSHRGLPRRLMEAGCLIQANASCFLSGMMAPMALRLLRRDEIHLLGSDCHDLRSRPPRLGPAREKIAGKLGQELLDRVDSLGREILFGA